MDLTKFIIIFFITFLSGICTASPLSEKEFSTKVLDLLKEQADGRQLEATDDPLLIKYDQNQYGLLNIYKRYLNEKEAGTWTDDTLKNHLLTILNTDTSQKSSEWESIKSIIYPMITAIEYLEAAPLAHSKIDSYIIAALVIDSSESFRYVTESDIKKWGLSFNEVFEIAESNLNEISIGVPLQGSLEGVKFLMLTTGDGFDAARILSPKFREFAGQQLGFPFHAGLPNRDFIVMWSDDNPEDVKANFRSNVVSDYEEQPYPRTPDPLLIEESGISVK